MLRVKVYTAARACFSVHSGVQKRLIIGCLTIFLRCAAVLPVNKVASGEGSSLRTHGTLLLVRHSSYGPTINRRLLADCTKLYTGVEIASGKGRA